MDTKQVVARFESERQALALMDHPAKVGSRLGPHPDDRPRTALPSAAVSTPSLPLPASFPCPSPARLPSPYPAPAAKYPFVLPWIARGTETRYPGLSWGWSTTS
jgi:hypothetical protein